MRTLSRAALAAAVFCAVSAPVSAEAPPLRIAFAPSEEPLVLFTDDFTARRPEQARGGPARDRDGSGEVEAPRGDLWFGILPRRLPDEPLNHGPNYVPFAALYEGGAARRAWFDLNLNHDLSDDEAVEGWTDVSAPGVRVFDFDLHWSAPFGAGEVTVARTLRVIVSPCLEGDGCAPQYRVLDMRPLRGTALIGGARRRALLYDGGGDGLYTAASGLDGVVIDHDGNGRFDGFEEIRMYSPEYGSLGGPMQFGRAIYEASAVDARGAEVTLRPVGEAAEPLRFPSPGEPAPDVAFVDDAGRAGRVSDSRGRVLVLYFTASWCGTCADEARRVARLGERHRARGLDVLAVSLDVDRARWSEQAERVALRPAEGGRRVFTGRWLWENPFGRPYLVNSAPSYVVIDREGRFAGMYGDSRALGQAVGRLLKRRAGEPARDPAAAGPDPEASGADVSGRRTDR